MRLIFRTARLYTRGTNLASAMSFLADLQVRGRLFPRQDRFCFGEFRPVAARGRHLPEFRIERLRTNRVARGLRRAPGAQQRVEAVRSILQHDLVFGQCIRSAFRFEQHVREHFARGDTHGIAAIFVLAIGRRA